MKISVVIPNYNGRNLLLSNIPKVIDALSTYKGEKELIITDDASQDGSVSAVTHLLSDSSRKIPYTVLVNTTGHNEGFASNVNKGVRASTGEIIILLNTDVSPRKNFLKALLKHFNDEGVFAIGCMDESMENGKTILRGRGLGKWEKGFLVHRAGSVDGESTLWVSGGSGAFRKSVWDRLGGLNELYNPFYWEDIDISYRAQKAGYRTLFEKESIVVHEHSKGAIKKQYSPFAIKKIAYRNQFFFTWLNATDTMLIASHLAWLPYFFLRSLKSGDMAFFYGFILALSKLPAVWSYRQKMKRLYTKTDMQVVSLYQ